MIDLCGKHKLLHTVEAEDDMAKRNADRHDIFHTFQAGVAKESCKNFPMVGNFVSLYLPLGHIKSTMPNDEEFVFRTRTSDKWLNTLF
jgi:hypothetical protein